jgi:hypothetical protein
VIVRHREVAYDYPVTPGAGWAGGFHTTTIELTEPRPSSPEAPPPPAPILCTVPALRGLSLRAAKRRLRSAHCGIGQVHLAAGATAGAGKVVKQFRAAGTELAAGAPVAVKLGPR